MPYTVQDWADNVTPVDEQHLDHMEQGIADAHTVAGTAQSTAIAAQSAASAAQATADAAVPKALVDAAGDLLVGSGSDLLARLAKGAEGEVLMVKAGVLDWEPGVSWNVIDAAGDLIVGTGPDAVARLGKGADGQVLKTLAGALAWDNETGGGGGALPADTVIPAGTRIISNKLLAGDAQPVWRLLGDGKQEWGPGGAGALDVSLARTGAPALRVVGGEFQVQRTGVLPALSAHVLGDAHARILVQTDGRIEWGSGSATRDTVLYRAGADSLKTDDSFSVGGSSLALTGAGTALIAWAAAAATVIIRFRATGDAQDRFVTNNIGTMVWGDGTATGDTNLYRAAADVLKTDDTFQSAANIFAAAGGAADTRIGGVGPAGQAGVLIGVDTNLYRFAADQLKSDDGLRLGTHLALDGTGGGAFVQVLEQSADPAAGAANSARLFAKDDGGGRTQLMARMSTGTVIPIATEGDTRAQRILSATAVWDAPSVAAGGGTQQTTIAVTGAALGDPVIASLSSLTTQALIMGATVTAADTVRITLLNGTGGAIDLPSGTLRVAVFKF